MHAASPSPSLLPEAVDAYIGLGSNQASLQGDSFATLQSACRALAQLSHSSLRAVSRFYRSAAAEGAAGSADFINAVAHLHTRLPALELLHALQAIERAHQRQRPYHHAPRTLDLDLLLHGNTMLQSAELTLPHPRMCNRSFVLLPLAELAPELVSNQHLQGVSGQKCEITSNNIGDAGLL